MCVIIHKPADKRISYRMIRRAYHANQHGWGIVAKDAKGRLSVARGTSGVGDLITEYKKVEDQEVLIHCRIATSGEKDIANTHPFEVMNGVWMMHNGSLTSVMVPIKDKTKCDSWHFANHILAPIFKNNKLFLKYPEELKFIEDLEEYIGKYSSNKIVIMSKFGPTIIAGKSKGEVRDGVWYSNPSAFRGSEEHKKRAARFATKGSSSTSSPSNGYYASGWGDADDYGYYYRGGTYSHRGAYKPTASGHTQSGDAHSPVSSHPGGSGTVVPIDSKRNNATTGELQRTSETGSAGAGTGTNGSASGRKPDQRNPAAHHTTGKTIPSYDDAVGERDFEVSHLQLTEDLRLAEDLNKEAAEELRWDAAFRYSEILANFSLDDLKIVVEKYPEGIAEVLYYTLNGEISPEDFTDAIYSDMPTDDDEPETETKPTVTDQPDDLTEEEEKRARNRAQDAYENVLDQEFSRLPEFNELWQRCFLELEGDLTEEEIIHGIPS